MPEINIPAESPMPEISYGSDRLPFTFMAVNEAMVGINKQREQLQEEGNDPVEVALGIDGKGVFICADEVPGPAPGEPDYLVRLGWAAKLGRRETLDDATELPDIKLIEERVPNNKVYHWRNGTMTMMTQAGKLRLPRPHLRATDIASTLDGVPIIPLKQVEPEQNVKLGQPDGREEHLDPEEKEVREMIEMNTKSLKKILKDNPTEVRDAQTGRQMTRGVTRQIAFDARDEVPITPGYFNSGIYEATVGDSEEVYYTVRYFAQDERGRFTGRHCIALVNPMRKESVISSLDPETNAYSDFEPMTSGDHYQLRVSLFGVYQEALDDKNKNGRRIWPGLVVAGAPQQQ
jgi:hypothetical protein